MLWCFRSKQGKINSPRKYNESTVYECFNKPFSVDRGSPDLNPPHIIIGDSYRPNKRYQYTPDTLPAAIDISPVKYISNPNKTSESPQVILLNFDAPKTDHTIMKYKPFHTTEKIGYLSGSHD